MRAERFVDTNVLLAATVPARPDHLPALACLERGFAERALCLSGQVLREYVAVATRPIAANGLGLTHAQALENTRQFRQRATFLREDEHVHAALIALLQATGSVGKQVHDANIVATMLAHGVGELLTLNPRDFERYAPRIRVVGLDAAR
jgi:predicted nucleic acid-binding protein